MSLNTLPFNPFPPSSDQKGSGGSYVLPIASAETLGGVKVGEGLTINGETGVLSADSQIVDYSTTEQATGQKWIDGKNIFRKVFNNIELTDNTDVTVEQGFSSSKTIVSMNAVFTAINTSGTQVIQSSSFVSSGSLYAFPRLYNGDLKIVVNGDMHDFVGFLVVEYTKTESEE